MATLRTSLVIASTIGLGLAWAWPQLRATDATRSDYLDHRGQPRPVMRDGVRATVWIFVRHDCPVANRYAPELSRLAADYGPRNVDLHLIYVDDDETPDTIAEHRQAYQLSLPARWDPEHRLVAHAGVGTTPEVAVFDSDRVLRYRGRIDDRVAALGKVRPSALQHDLREALDRLLAGERPPLTTTPAIGCSIARRPRTEARP